MSASRPGRRVKSCPSLYSLVQPLLLAVASVVRQEGEVEEAVPHRLVVEEGAVVVAEA